MSQGEREGNRKKNWEEGRGESLTLIFPLNYLQEVYTVYVVAIRHTVSPTHSNQTMLSCEWAEGGRK